MNTLLSNIAQERESLQNEIAVLGARIASTQEVLNVLYDKLSRLDKAEAALRGESLTVFQSVKPKVATVNPLEAPLKQEMTIKQMVLQILNDNPEGLVALDILDEIEIRFDKTYARTSLSPQLSRLFNDGKIHKRGKVWILGQSPFGSTLTEGEDLM